MATTRACRRNNIDDRSTVPTKPLSPCLQPGCPELTANRYCDRHRREYDQRRGGSSARGYGAAWRRLRLVILHRDPVCRACGREPANEVDHIVSKTNGGTDDPSNLQGLCKACHSRKTVLEDTPSWR